MIDSPNPGPETLDSAIGEGPADRASGPLHRHNEKRSLILCAIGAIGGLIIAGAGLFTAQGTRIAGVPPEDIAIVNQVPILMSDYVTQLQANEGVGLSQATVAQKRKVLDQMIREELYVQRGIELGLQSDIIEVRQALVGAVEAQQAVDASATQPSEQALQAIYQHDIVRYNNEGTMLLDDYIAPSLVQAQTTVAAIRGGEPITGAVSTHALKSSGKMNDGQEFYFAAKIHLGDQLFKIAEGLRAGQVSDPVVAPDGVHILFMHQNTPPVPAGFDEVREQVLANYRADKVARMQSGADAFLRKRADIQIAQGFE